MQAHGGVNRFSIGTTFLHIEKLVLNQILYIFIIHVFIKQEQIEHAKLQKN